MITDLAKLFTIARILVPLQEGQRVLYSCTPHGFELIKDDTGKTPRLFLDYVYGGEEGSRVDLSMVHAQVTRPAQFYVALKNALKTPRQTFEFGEHMFRGSCRQNDTFYISLWHRAQPRHQAIHTSRGIGTFPASLLEQAVSQFITEAAVST